MLTLWLSLGASAQLDVTKEPVKFWFFNPHIGIQFPGGDMKERFHNNAMVGFGVNHKTAGSWIFGLGWSYLFAENVRNEHQIIQNISTAEGNVIDKTGVFANIQFRQRGHYIHFNTGRLFQTRFGNPNSGVFVMATAGLLMHKIRIEVHEQTAPQLYGEYLKGYDRLSSGPGGSLYLGYMHVSDNKFVNFSIGAEYLYAATKSVRNYDFALMRKDDSVRDDRLFTIRFNWMIPVYARAAREFYY